jgi:hypothetical protein
MEPNPLLIAATFPFPRILSLFEEELRKGTTRDVAIPSLRNPIGSRFPIASDLSKPLRAPVMIFGITA